MGDSQWTLIGVVIASLLTFYGVLRKSRSDERVASGTSAAAQVTAMGVRLDAQDVRIEKLEKKVRALYRYIDEDHDDHRANGWPIKPLPEELA